MNRPSRLVVVAGTATEVGKTWVGAAVARELRDRGTTVAARKPAQSFEPADVEPGGIGTDADALAAWSIVHGFATLWLSGALPPRVGDDPEAAARTVIRRLFD